MGPARLSTTQRRPPDPTQSRSEQHLRSHERAKRALAHSVARRSAGRLGAACPVPSDWGQGQPRLTANNCGGRHMHVMRRRHGKLPNGMQLRNTIMPPTSVGAGPILAPLQTRTRHTTVVCGNGPAGAPAHAATTMAAARHTRCTLVRTVVSSSTASTTTHNCIVEAERLCAALATVPPTPTRI